MDMRKQEREVKDDQISTLKKEIELAKRAIEAADYDYDIKQQDLQNIQRQIRMANKPKKIQPGQGQHGKDSFYSRGSSNITRSVDASVISQVLE